MSAGQVLGGWPLVEAGKELKRKGGQGEMWVQNDPCGRDAQYMQ